MFFSCLSWCYKNIVNVFWPYPSYWNIETNSLIKMCFVVVYCRLSKVEKNPLNFTNDYFCSEFTIQLINVDLS